MRKKLFLIFGIFALIVVSLITSIYADDVLYGKNGVLVYPGYILKTVCHPYMPCGIERIDIPNDNNDNYYSNNNYNSNYNTKYNNQNSNTNTNSPGGFFNIFTPTYDPTLTQNQYNDNNQNSNSNTRTVTVTIVDQNNNPSQNNNNYNYQDSNQPSIKHFPDTYNTRNNYDSNGNWIGDNRNSNDQDYNSQRYNSRYNYYTDSNTDYNTQNNENKVQNSKVIVVYMG